MVNSARISRSLILGLIILSLVLFYIYSTSNLIQFNFSATYIEQQNQYNNNTNYKPKLPIKLPSPIAVPTEKLDTTTNNSNNTTSIAEETLIELVDENDDELTDNIATKELYNSGYDIPNLDLCPNSGASLQFLVLITSAPNNTVARMGIRQTWGHYAQRKDIRIGFILGRAKTPELISKVKSESDLYGDIIACRIMDSYDNLTLKTTSMMGWIDSYCPKVKFILKTDDDMFINVPKLISFVESQHNTTRTIFGRLAQNWHPFRDPSSKWFISKEHYAPEVFPDFTTGPAYLFTGDIAHDLYVKALNTTYLKLEDVFMTGVVAQGIGAKRFNAKEFLNTEVKHSVINLKNYISIHKVKYHEQFDLWTKLLDSRE